MNARIPRADRDEAFAIVDEFAHRGEAPPEVHCDWLVERIAAALAQARADERERITRYLADRAYTVPGREAEWTRLIMRELEDLWQRGL